MDIDWKKNIVSVEAITWQYYTPLGAPLSHAKDDKYSGSVKGQGIGLAYQRFIRKGLYSALHATWFKQHYKDENISYIGDGNQLFLTLRLGYRFSFFNSTFFVEPSAALTHWPINKGLPDSFEEKEREHRKFQFEPGLHIGVNF